MDTVILASLVAALSLVLYVLLDGFDLGVGALLLFARDEAERDLMVTSVAPVWDGNETWLIMAGVTLLGCFPVAYGILLPAFYLPLLIMLWSLGFRGVAFEFRFQQHSWRRLWDGAFAFGSIMAALCQGLVLGGVVQGVAVRGGSFAGGTFDFLSPLSMLTAALVLVAYALLGAGWLIWRTENLLLAFARRAHRVACVLTGVLGACFAALGATEIGGIAALWREHTIMSAAAVAAFFAVLAGAASLGRRRADALPLLASVAVVAVGVLGIAPAIWPYAVPHAVTIWQAASPPGSRLFLLVGVIALMPVVLGYTAFAYWIFRGKVKPLEAVS